MAGVSGPASRMTLNSVTKAVVLAGYPMAAACRSPIRLKAKCPGNEWRENECGLGHPRPGRIVLAHSVGRPTANAAGAMPSSDYIGSNFSPKTFSPF